MVSFLEEIYEADDVRTVIGNTFKLEEICQKHAGDKTSQKKEKRKR
jgi:hypothetical protein